MYEMCHNYSIIEIEPNKVKISMRHFILQREILRENQEPYPWTPC